MLLLNLCYLYLALFLKYMNDLVTCKFKGQVCCNITLDSRKFCSGQQKSGVTLILCHDFLTKGSSRMISCHLPSVVGLWGQQNLVWAPLSHQSACWKRISESLQLECMVDVAHHFTFTVSFGRGMLMDKQGWITRFGRLLELWSRKVTVREIALHWSHVEDTGRFVSPLIHLLAYCLESTVYCRCTFPPLLILYHVIQNLNLIFWAHYLKPFFLWMLHWFIYFSHLKPFQNEIL